MSLQFKMTLHAIQRFLERFDDEICEFLFNSQKLSKNFSSKREIKQQINTWKEQAESKIFKDHTQLKFILMELLAFSTEDKSKFNDTRYMTYLYSQYGFDRKYTFYYHPTFKINFVFIDNNTDQQQLPRLITVY